MIDLVGKRIDRCGWSGPLLWILTTDGYAVNLYDAPIEIGGARVEEGADVSDRLIGNSISAVHADGQWFTVSLSSGKTLRVEKSTVETARLFKKGDLASHVVYQHGALVDDQAE